MKTLCVGGTFDPIHNGHLICARAAAESIGASRVLFVPCAMTNHKSDKTDFKHRYEMCRAAIDGDQMFQVSDIEQIVSKEQGNSYTANVANEISKHYGGSLVNWFVGADTVPKAMKWYNQELLKRVVHFVIAERPGYDINTIVLTQRGFSFEIVPATLVDISSSAIRDRIKAGKSIRYMTPDAVDDYIFGNYLYGGG